MYIATLIGTFTCNNTLHPIYMSNGMHSSGLTVHVSIRDIKTVTQLYSYNILYYDISIYI